ncbi:MAG: hypothetical protein CL678_09855 [Bdellovibrionaceae bacterium]|nr:hypothetical protein [Pseudobdellovibrionaceae bacterium]|tara:strand:+ start:325 stop:561 length:237 start_codon:yes stop_codon:yes gene_type:complete
MAKKKEGKAPAGPQSMGPVSCVADGCSAKIKKFGFCKEHYQQFKFGLVTREGHKAADYDKKLEHYLRHYGDEGLRKVA